MRWPAAISGRSACGTPAWASSPGGEPRALEVGRSRRPRRGAVAPRGARPGRCRAPSELTARERPGVAVGQDLEGARRRWRAGPRARRRQTSVVLGRLEDDRIGLPADRAAIAGPSSGQLTYLLVGGHDAVDRPAQVDRRRAGVPEGVRRAAERGPPGVWPRVLTLAAVSAMPIAATCPIAGAPRTIISRIACAAWAADRILLEDLGKLPLVDEVEGRVPPPGTASGTRSVRGRGGAPWSASGDPIRGRLGSRIARPLRPTRWSAWAAPTTVAAPWNSSPANSEEPRRSRSRSSPGAGRRPASPTSSRPVPFRRARRGVGLPVGQWAPRCGDPEGASVLDDAGDAPALESVATLQEVELDEERKPDDLTLQPLDELDRLDRAAGREQVVDDEDLLARPRSSRWISRVLSRTRGRTRR